jgi:predicted GNAT family acetyltransferase
MEPDILNNKERSRFETILNREYAFLEYILSENIMDLHHTFVPESMRGMGIAHSLAHYALEYVKANQIMVKITCPFVKKYLASHPEYLELLQNQN